MPPFYFDPIINPISAYKEEKNRNIATTELTFDESELNLDDIEMPEEFEPFLYEEPLYDT